MKIRFKLAYTLFVLLTLIASSCVKELDKEITPDYDAPIDDFLGSTNSVILHNGFDDFTHKSAKLYIRTPEKSIITRNATIKEWVPKGRLLELDHGLKDGKYELLHLEFQMPQEREIPELNLGHQGIACRIQVKDGRVTLIDKWNPVFKLYGSGTEIDTLRIASADQMVSLTLNVANGEYNGKWENTYFLQTADLDGREMSMLCSRNYGWVPIGFLNTTPFQGSFDGNGYKISGLEISRKSTMGVGLFGFVQAANIKNIIMENADLVGDLAVGGIIGSILSSQGKMFCSVMQNCSVSNSTIRSAEGGFSVGGLVGLVDEYTALNLNKCRSNNNTISATMNAGGIVGSGVFRSLILTGLCENSSNVTSDYGCAGGIVGACDTLYASVCKNSGAISGAVKYIEGDEEKGLSGLGAGGIAGGAGLSSFNGCINNGEIRGYKSVGGIVGSTRFTGSLEGEDYLCQNTFIQYCSNRGDITGTYIVGGLCGEAQAAVYESLNKGKINARESYAGGIVGVTSLGIIQNNVNTGEISAKTHAAGITGVCLTGTFTINHNYGNIYAMSSHAGGLIGYAGRDVTLTYCGNFGTISSSEANPMGGLLAECGDLLEQEGFISDKAKIAIAVIETSVSVVTSIAGAVLGCFKLPKGEGARSAVILFNAFSFFGGVGFFAYDTACFSFGIGTIVDVDNLIDLAEETENELNLMKSQIKSEIASEREKFTPVIPAFSSNVLSEKYSANINAQENFYNSSEENAKLFDDGVQDDRIEKIKKVAQDEKDKMVNHAIASGVAMALTTVSLLCSAAGLALITAGTAIPGILAACFGVPAALLGGANTIHQTITKTDYNLNTVVECVNGGNLHCPVSNPNAGGLVGVMHDYGSIRDCLNTGEGPGNGGHFVGVAHSETSIVNSLTIAPFNSWGSIVTYEGHNNSTSGLYHFIDSQEAANGSATNAGKMSDNVSKGLTIEEIGKAEKFEGWNIGTQNEIWTIPQGYDKPFPIIFVSKYTNQNN